MDSEEWMAPRNVKGFQWTPWDLPGIREDSCGTPLDSVGTPTDLQLQGARPSRIALTWPPRGPCVALAWPPRGPCVALVWNWRARSSPTVVSPYRPHARVRGVRNPALMEEVAQHTTLGAGAHTDDQ